MELKEFTDEQLQKIISPTATGLADFSLNSDKVAVALLAQLVLENRRNRALHKEYMEALVSLGKDGLGAFMPVVGPLIAKLKVFLEEILVDDEPLAPAAVVPVVENPDFAAAATEAPAKVLSKTRGE
jgi:hypothetical protein